MIVLFFRRQLGNPQKEVCSEKIQASMSTHKPTAERPWGTQGQGTAPGGVGPTCRLRGQAGSWLPVPKLTAFQNSKEQKWPPLCERAALHMLPSDQVCLAVSQPATLAPPVPSQDNSEPPALTA